MADRCAWEYPEHGRCRMSGPHPDHMVMVGFDRVYFPNEEYVEPGPRNRVKPDAFGDLVKKAKDSMKTPADAQREADEAMERVDGAASPAYKAKLRGCVMALADLGEDFTTDHVWQMIDLTDWEPNEAERRALGPVVQSLLREGYMEEIAMTKSVRRHGTRIPVYCRKF